MGASRPGTARPGLGARSAASRRGRLRAIAVVAMSAVLAALVVGVIDVQRVAAVVPTPGANESVITVRVGGVRGANNAVGPVAGVVLRLYEGSGNTPGGAGHRRVGHVHRRRRRRLLLHRPGHRHGRREPRPPVLDPAGERPAGLVRQLDPRDERQRLDLHRVPVPHPHGRPPARRHRVPVDPGLHDQRLGHGRIERDLGAVARQPGVPGHVRAERGPGPGPVLLRGDRRGRGRPPRRSHLVHRGADRARRRRSRCSRSGPRRPPAARTTPTGRSRPSRRRAAPPSSRTGSTASRSRAARPSTRTGTAACSRSRSPSRPSTSPSS